MKRAHRWLKAGCLGIALIAGGAMAAWAAPQAAGQAAQPTRAEYDALTAERKAGMTDPMMQIMLLDDFMMKYPMSTYISQGYIYLDYYTAYAKLKNYPKTIEYADKLVALGNTIALANRLQALYVRSQAFAQAVGSDKTLQTPDAYMKARDQAQLGLQLLMQFVASKPQGISEADLAKANTTYSVLFNSVEGTADSGLKDYKAAVDAYRAVLVNQPMDAPTHYFLGVAYLQEMPADSLNGFWELSRAIALKIPNDGQVRMFLHNRVAAYQGGPSCDNLVDGEINDLVMAAGTATDRPATLMIPSADDLMKARDDTANFIPWLMEGGDHGKVMWLATCGSQYPDFPVWVMDVQAGGDDNATLMAYRPAATDPDAAEKETEAATMPNVKINVTMQPGVSKIMKDNSLRFTGTLTGYQQMPFQLTFDNAQVNADDLKDLLAPTPGKKPARGGARGRAGF